MHCLDSIVPYICSSASTWSLLFVETALFCLERVKNNVFSGQCYLADNSSPVGRGCYLSSGLDILSRNTREIGIIWLNYSIPSRTRCGCCILKFVQDWFWLVTIYWQETGRTAEEKGAEAELSSYSNVLSFGPISDPNEPVYTSSLFSPFEVVSEISGLSESSWPDAAGEKRTKGEKGES